MPAAARITAPGDLTVPGARGVPGGLTIPAVELLERFSRSSGPGGQSVNTTDSRVELRFDIANSSALTETQRDRALHALQSRLVGGMLSITNSEQRSQLQNRIAARGRLIEILHESLVPPPRVQRRTKPSRAAQQRRLDAKKQRSQTKAGRGRPSRQELS